MRNILAFLNKRQRRPASNNLKRLKNYLIRVNPHSRTLASQGGYYLASNYATMYKFPAPPTTPIVFGIISLGGGLVGDTTVVGNSSSPTLRLTNNSNSDINKYLALCGKSNVPNIYIVQLLGAVNTPNNDATYENTIDVETIAANCNGSNVTIVLYLAPNTWNGFNAVMSAASTGTTINGINVKPNVISCSWGASEQIWREEDLTGSGLNQILSNCTVPVCAASGDNGASDGTAAFATDYPSSSPYVISCGGTTMYNPSLDYAAPVSEVAWSGGGGGFSAYFNKPSWQPGTNSKRSTPDIAMNADPNTGVKFIVFGTNVVFGGTSIVAPAMAALIGCIGPSKFAQTVAKPRAAARLYAASSAFNDIKTGNNFGYIAVSGIDRCTGLGTPKGNALNTAITAQH